jgi:hypothetical protein
MHPDNTVICQVKIAAMKAAQEAKSSKSTCKRKEKYIFSIISKASVVKLVLLFNISSDFLVISNSYFSEAQPPLPGFVPLL